MLSGIKTYVAAALAVLLAIAGVLTGEITILQGVEAIGLATGLAGSRWVVRAIEIIGSIRSSATADPVIRMAVTHIGTIVTILAAILAQLNGEQTIAVTISAILSALGINFLGLGAQSTANTVKSG